MELLRPKDQELPSSTIIVTSGHKLDVIGFTNEVHCDDGDRLNLQEQILIDEKLEVQHTSVNELKQAKKISNDSYNRSEQILHYVSNFKSNYGLGLPTSIMHEHVLDKEI